MKKRKNNTKFIIIVVLIAILLGGLFFSFNLKRNPSIIEDNLKNITSKFNELVTPKVKSNNSEVITKNIDKELERENSELKDILSLNKNSNYDMVNASILSRNKAYWFNTIIIDKGKNNNIKEKMAVVTKNGLIGIINKVYKTTSEVKLITADDLKYKISVLITNLEGESYATLDGYEKNNNLLKLKGIDKYSNIHKGDTILTSSYQDIFPKGIYIGKIEKVENDKYDLSKTAYVKVNEDFNNIHYVTVIRGNK